MARDRRYDPARPEARRSTASGTTKRLSRSTGHVGGEMAASDAAIATHDLTVSFGDVTAVDGLSLTVPDGSVYGFLGPNGAGKSTTIGALLGYVTPDAGTVDVLGRTDVGRDPSIRRRVGVMPEDADPYPRLTGRDHIRFAARSKHVDSEADALLDRVGLADAAERRAGGYSTGMTKRLLLATALVGEPDLLVLDEPTSGLDPNGARMVREVVREQRDRGATVFFSSHEMGQVEAVCDTVGIVQDGALVAEAGVDALRRESGDGTRLTVTVDATTSGLADALADVEGVSAVAVDEDARRISATCRDGAAKLATLDAIRDHAEVVDFATEERSLDDVFSALTTEEDVEGAPADGGKGSP
jgi:ABC-2 type transport system ATP-binding protein